MCEASVGMVAVVVVVDGVAAAAVVAAAVVVVDVVNAMFNYRDVTSPLSGTLPDQCFCYHDVHLGS